MHWFGEAVPRELRVGDHWNDALIIEITGDSIVGQVPMRIPDVGLFDYSDDRARKSSGKTPS